MLGIFTSIVFTDLLLFYLILPHHFPCAIAKNFSSTNNNQSAHSSTINRLMTTFGVCAIFVNHLTSNSSSPPILISIYVTCMLLLSLLFTFLHYISYKPYAISLTNWRQFGFSRQWWYNKASKHP